jgi:hypothetical protein
MLLGEKGQTTTFKISVDGTRSNHSYLCWHFGRFCSVKFLLRARPDFAKHTTPESRQLHNDLAIYPVSRLYTL